MEAKGELTEDSLVVAKECHVSCACNLGWLEGVSEGLRCVTNCYPDVSHPPLRPKKGCLNDLAISKTLPSIIQCLEKKVIRVQR